MNRANVYSKHQIPERRKENALKFDSLFDQEPVLANFFLELNPVTRTVSNCDRPNIDGRKMGMEILSILLIHLQNHI